MARIGSALLALALASMTCSVALATSKKPGGGKTTSKSSGNKPKHEKSHKST